MIYADIGPLTKTTTQNIQSYFLDDNVVEYASVQVSDSIREETHYQDAGDIFFTYCMHEECMHTDSDTKLWSLFQIKV